MTAEDLIRDLKTAKVAVRRDPKRMTREDAHEWVDVILKEVGDRIMERTRFLQREIQEMQEDIKALEDAWERWDFDDLEDLEMLSRDDREFASEALDLYPL
jgi:hypothetical protein